MQQITCNYPDSPWWHGDVFSSQGSTPGIVLKAGCFYFSNSAISQATHSARGFVSPFFLQSEQQPPSFQCCHLIFSKKSSECWFENLMSYKLPCSENKCVFLREFTGNLSFHTSRVDGQQDRDWGSKVPPTVKRR